MKTLLQSLVCAVALCGVASADAPQLLGVWRAADGSGAARIEACADNATRLCAVVVADTPEPGAPSRVGELALSDLQPTGRDRWRGRYHDGAQTLPATIRMRSADRVDMRVCVGMFCATEEYHRAGR